MRTDAELSQIALDFVSDCTTPQSIFEYAAELEKLGSHGAKIPAMRAQKWKLVIDALIASRKLHEVNGVLLAAIESKQEFRQMDLFGA